MSTESAALVKQHKDEYKTVLNDATATKGADSGHKADAARKLATDLTDIQKKDPTYFNSIVSKLNGKFKAEDLGLPAGDTLLGGVSRGGDNLLAGRNHDGTKMDYVGSEAAGDSKAGRVQADAGHLNDAPVPTGSPESPSRLAQRADGSATYHEGKDDHDYWDVARHALGYNKLDSLAKKNEAANLIKLMQNDPENKGGFKPGGSVHIPPMTFGKLAAPDAPKAPEAPMPAVVPGLEQARQKGLITPEQAAVPGGQQAVEQVQHDGATDPAKAKKEADAMVAALPAHTQEMLQNFQGAFTPQLAKIMGVDSPDKIQFHDYNQLDQTIDQIKAGQDAGTPETKAMLKGLEYIKKNFGEFTRTATGPLAHNDSYVNAQKFKTIMDNNHFALLQYEELQKQYAQQLAK